MAFCKHRVMDKCKKDNRPCIFSKECCEPEEKKMTNADRIRNFSDEELLDFLCGIDTYRVDGGQILWIDGYRMEDTRENISIWLQAEGKEGASNAST